MRKDIKAPSIYPSILSDSKKTVSRQLGLLRQHQVPFVQLDVIDGFYAGNLTLTPSDYAEYEFGQLQVDFHLMVEEPLDYVYEILDHKEKLPVRAIIAQVERMSHQANYVSLVKEVGFLVGLSYDLYTPFESIDASVWPDLDFVQVMGVEAGFQGQQFSSASLELIHQVIKWRADNKLDFKLLVDGGVKPEILDELKTLELDGLVVGSFLWQAENFQNLYDI